MFADGLESDSDISDALSVVRQSLERTAKRGREAASEKAALLAAEAKRGRMEVLRNCHDLTTSMDAFKFRYTLTVDEFAAAKMTEIMSFLVEMFECVHYVCGFEDLNKYKEVAKPHIHLHYTTTLTDKVMRDRFKKWRKAQVPIDPRIRTDLYALTKTDDIKDPNGFYRYPLKQKHSGVPPQMYPPFGFNSKEQGDMANDQWERAAFNHLARRAKDDLKTTVLGRMTDEIETSGVVLTSVRDVGLWMSAYYTRNGMSACFKTISGYAATYAMTHGVITVEQWYDQKGCV